MMRIAEKINQLLILKDASNASKENFKVWFLQQFDDSENNITNKCCLEDFAVYFLNAVRTRAEVHLKANETEALKETTASLDTPSRKSLSCKKKFYEQAKNRENSLRLQELNDSQQLENEEHSLNNSFKYNTSTPLRRVSSSSSINSPGQSRHTIPNNFSSRSCITPNSIEKIPRNTPAGGGGGSSICLGDFFSQLTPNNKSINSKKSTSQSAGKPKKRVVPTTISSLQNVDNNRNNSSTAFGNNSAFSNENNILKISSLELEDKDKCSILEARATLKQRAKEISRELESSMTESKKILVSNTLESCQIPKKINYTALLDAIKTQTNEQSFVIERMAAIYSLFMDMNFTTNILNELSLLINILNANIVFRNDKSIIGNTSGTPNAHLELQIHLPKGSRQEIFEDYSSSCCLDMLLSPLNCVAFAVCVLNKQRNILAMLDLKSLRVVLYSECLLALSEELKRYLENVYQCKQNDAQEKKRDYFPTLSLKDKSFNNVYYQEDKDSRQNFPSNIEFGAFKSQRDLFYKTLKCWEANHLNSAFNFQQEITPKIKEIFRLSEHPVNMARFAELFASQLLISANYATSPEEIGIDIDPQKFSKLSQRLTAPSNFSVEYQFPYNQAFFRDFILEARSIAFIEQLKSVVYNKLIMLNNSTYNLLNIFKESENHDEYLRSTYIACPEVMSSLQVLAKFLGFIIVLPFQYTNQSTTPVEDLPNPPAKAQIELRSLLQSNLNMDRILKGAIKNGKILITLPWMAQYLSMLDNISLQLDCYSTLLQLMFCIFIQLDVTRSEYNSMAVFIIRCCLGWLFDSKPIITEQFYNFRINYFSENGNRDIMKLDESHLLLPLATIRSDQTDLNLLLESILDVTCPFLAEFRVSIMPAKCTMTKYVSRSGRYRYITTRISELQSTNEHKIKNGDSNSPFKTLNTSKTCYENKLMEAFLHSQNSNIRQLLEFITERIYKSTIRDVELNILIPSKSRVDFKVDSITSSEYNEVYKALQTILQEARLSAVYQWEASIPLSINERITLALDSLLPKSVEPILKQAYFHIIYSNTLTKLNHWRQANIFSPNFYCPSIQELIQKICKMNKKVQHKVHSVAATTSSELEIKTLTPSTSYLLDELQFLLHFTSLRPENVSDNVRILNFLQELPLMFDNILPTTFYRVVGTGAVNLLQNLIAKHPKFLTDEVIDAFQLLWTKPEMRKHILQCEENQGKEKGVDDLDDNETLSNSTPSIFDGLITIAFIESLNEKSCFNKLTEIFLKLIRGNVLTLDFINTLFVPIYKWDWHPSILNDISTMLQTIAKESQIPEMKGDLNYDLSYDDMKSNLFMEVLADFARDVDDF